MDEETYAKMNLKHYRPNILCLDNYFGVISPTRETMI